MTPRETVADAHRRYRHAVERAAARILRDRDEAGDVASEAYLAMLERGPDDRRAALSWLLTTARNRALNVVRDRQRAARRLLEIPEPPADAPLVDAHQTDLVSRAMATLSERDQAAVLMRYVAEASPTEIAETLGVTVPVARVVVHRAIKRLRAQTVLLLAGHHGAGRECAARLQRQASSGVPTGHDQCGACAAVADEVAALTAHSLLPVAALPAARHAASRLQDFAATLKANLHGLESRTAEAAAVLLIATGMVAPGATPVSSQRPAVVAAAAARDSAAIALPISKPDAPVAGRAAAAATRPTTLATDAEGDTNHLVGPPSGVTVLGATLRLPDALNGSAKRGHDIRSIAAYTQAGRDGAPETLVFLLGMADAPPRNSMFTVTWTFEGTGCTGDATTQTGSETSSQPVSWMTVACVEELDITAINREPASWYQSLTPSIDGNVVAVRIPLRALDEDMRDLFEPGQVLSNLFASSQAGTGGVYSGVDQAPDGGQGLRYTIGSR